MTLTIPTAGAPILDTWGAAVAAQLNRQLLMATTADVSTDSASAQSITGLSFAVESGKSYFGYIFGAYMVSATNQGLQLGWNGPTGTGRLHGYISGNGSETGHTDYQSSGGLQGRTSTDAADPSRRVFQGWFWFQANADGTVQFQFARGGTSGSTGVTILEGSGGCVYANQ